MDSGKSNGLFYFFLMKVKYVLNRIKSILLLPLLFYQGKQIRKKVPSLPEAKNPVGFINLNSNEALKMICIGESTIAGVGAEIHENAFSGTLAKTLAEALKKNVSWKVYARSGYTMNRLNKKLIPKIEADELDLIVIGMGANDAFRLNNIKNWNREVENCISKLRSKFSCPIVFLNMPPIKEFPAFSSSIKSTIGELVEFLGAALKENIQDKEKVYYNEEVVTLEQYSKRYKLDQTIDKYFSDGVHPSLLTYQIWAKETAKFIMQKGVLK